MSRAPVAIDAVWSKRSARLEGRPHPGRRLRPFAIPTAIATRVKATATPIAIGGKGRRGDPGFGAEQGTPSTAPQVAASTASMSAPTSLPSVPALLYDEEGASR